MYYRWGNIENGVRAGKKPVRNNYSAISEWIHNHSEIYRPVSDAKESRPMLTRRSAGASLSGARRG